jgi:hypothetical protein
MQDSNNMGKVFLSVALGEDGHVEDSCTRKLDLQIIDPLAVTPSVGRTYRRGGWLLSCPFLHLESFKLSGLLKMVVILVCCQSVIPSTSLLNVDSGGTCRNQVACVVALANLQREKVSVLDSNILISHTWPVEWPGTEQNISFSKNSLVNERRVFNAKCPEHFAWEGVKRGL